MFIVYLSLHVAISYEVAKETPIVRTISNADGTVKEKNYFDYKLLLKETSEHMAKTPYEIKWVDSTLKFLLGDLVILMFVLMWLSSNKRKTINMMEYGSAVWGKLSEIVHLFAKNVLKKEIKDIKKKYKGEERKEKIAEATEMIENSDILLAKKEKISFYHTDTLNTNVLCVSGSGGGKTTGVVIPNVLQVTDSKYSPCLVMTDPKGEVLQKTGYYVSQIAKYKVKVLNLKDQKKSFQYNPFKYINMNDDVGDMQTQILQLVTTIMEFQSDDNSQKGEEVWTKLAIACLESIFIATYYAFPIEERNINTAVELFKMFDISEDGDDDGYSTNLDFFFMAYEENFCDDKNALVASEKYWNFRRKCKGKTALSVLSTALAQLAPFDNPNIKHIFADDNMELDKIGLEQLAIYVVLPPTKKLFNFIANIFYTQLFDMIEYNATVLNEQKLPIPVKVILDEYYNTGKIAGMDNILSYARSFGVSIMIILQSLTQGKAMHKDIWNSFIDNCSSFLYLGGDKNPEDLKSMSEMVGKATYEKRNVSETRGKQGSVSISYEKFARDLLDSAEIGKIGRADKRGERHSLLLLTGYDPMYCVKNYFKYHKNYKYTWDADKKNNVFHYPSEVENKEKDTHGEDEKDNIQKKERTSLITVNYNEEEVLNVFSNNILNLDFENGEEVALSIDENEELQIIREILGEEERRKKKAIETTRQLSRGSLPIVFNTEPQKILETIQSFNQETVDFAYPIEELGESQEEIEEFEDDEDVEINLEELTKSLNLLESDMESSGFLNHLNNVDINTLFVGALQLEETEESIEDTEDEAV